MLYTKVGDKGLTTIFDCKKNFLKSSLRIEALGSLDELNSLLGFCKVKSLEVKPPIGGLTSKTLEDIQNDLFILQGEVAGCGKGIKKNRRTEIEKIIDKIEKKLPKIKNFIISGGTELSALLDYSRAVARRAERRCVASKKNISPESLKYLNRLSSLLFALARYVNLGIKEKHPRY
ncbi:MAG: cob(I)yrinic acid a,c-diamide adenosyltransferase [Patescibacteria group bacterium]